LKGGIDQRRGEWKTGKEGGGERESTRKIKKKKGKGERKREGV